MKVNAEFIIELRHQKFWSQEELAIAAGLNLRTIPVITDIYDYPIKDNSFMYSLFFPE